MAATSTICVPGYAAKVRDVPASEKLAVYAEYGIMVHPTGRYEIDHLVALELGGSNATGNLWPEFNDHPAGYLNSKDLLEDRLHQMVCSGVLALGVAQRAIAIDWVVAYHRYVGAWPAVSSSTTTTTIPSKPTPGAVSVTQVLSPIAPGSYELLKARSPKADDACSLSVTLPSGAASQSNGLGVTTATAAGELLWTWLIGTRTAPGTATALVSCTAGSTSKSFVIS